MLVQLIERYYLRDTSVFRGGRIVELIAEHWYQDHRHTHVDTLRETEKPAMTHVTLNVRVI